MLSLDLINHHSQVSNPGPSYFAQGHNTVPPGEFRTRNHSIQSLTHFKWSHRASHLALLNTYGVDPEGGGRGPDPSGKLRKYRVP